MEPKDRLKALRKRLGFTQEDVAMRSGGRLAREEVNKVERGKVGLNSWETRRGLAEAFRLNTDDFSDYVDGALELDEAVRMSEVGPTRVSSRRLRDRPEWEEALVAARAQRRAVPPEYFDDVGALIDTLKPRLTAQLLGEIARSLWEASLQERDHEIGPTSVDSRAASDEPPKDRTGQT